MSQVSLIKNQQKSNPPKHQKKSTATVAPSEPVAKEKSPMVDQDKNNFLNTIQEPRISGDDSEKAIKKMGFLVVLELKLKGFQVVFGVCGKLRN
ncbi:putative transcriptional regulatory protein [Sesbania bispinosa]|nr:putative transcriptional regulatory protein [Sesbania bispinosa]